METNIIFNPDERHIMIANFCILRAMERILSRILAYYGCLLHPQVLLADTRHAPEVACRRWRTVQGTSGLQNALM
jgi:hypothetical protein